MSKKTEETRIKKEIKDWLTLKGWFHYYNMASMNSYPGLCDRVAIKDGLVLFIEVKTKKSNQSDKQIQFELDVVSAGGHYLVARGYEDIEEYLKRLNDKR